MPQNFVEIILSARDQALASTLRSSERQIKSYGERTIATFTRVGQAVDNVSHRMINGLTTIGVGVGVVEITKDMIEFDGKLRKIGRTGGYSAGEVQGLRKEIVSLIDPAAKLKIPLTKGEWADVASELHNTGVELKTVKSILADVGRGAVASKTGPAIYSETIGEFIDKYKVDVKDLPALQEQVNTALKFPDVRKNPEAFLQVMQRMAKPMQLIHAQGIENVTAFMAMTAEISQFSGSAEEAQTSMDALINGLFRLSKNKDIRKALKQEGIDFFDAKGNVKPLQEVALEIKKLAGKAKEHGQDINMVAMKVMGRPEAGKAMMIISDRYDEIKKKQEELKNSTGGLSKDFGIETDTMTSKLKNFQNQIDKFKVDHMAGALKSLSGVLDALNKHPAIAKGIIGTAGGLFAALAAWRLFSTGKDIYDFFKGGKKGGPQLPGTSGAGGVGIPVHVTNWPGNMGNGKPGGILDKYGKPFPTEKTPGKTGPLEKGLETAKTVGKQVLPFIPGGVGFLGVAAFSAYADRPEVKKESTARLALASQVDAHMRAVSARNNPVAKLSPKASAGQIPIEKYSSAAGQTVPVQTATRPSIERIVPMQAPGAARQTVPMQTPAPSAIEKVIPVQNDKANSPYRGQNNEPTPFERYMNMFGSSAWQSSMQPGAVQAMPPDVKNNITLNITIDDKGRVFSDTTDKNTTSTILLRRGTF